jgi:hypothetical protein
MAKRPHLMYEVRGDPVVLRHAPDPALLREAGAGRTAEAVEKAIDLRERVRAAKAAVREAEAALSEAERRDHRGHAAAIADDPSAKLKPVHRDRAAKNLEDARRTHGALVTAVEDAADRLVEIGEDERERLTEVARKVRERSVERVERAAVDIERAIADEQAALSMARWAQDPTSKRWKVALASASIGSPSIRIDRIVAGLAALAPWLAEQPVPGEEPEQPGVIFGHGGLTIQRGPGQVGA